MKWNVLWIIALGLFSFASACGSTGLDPRTGYNLAVLKGCAACHAVDETPKIGPTWVGLYGSQVKLADGNFVTADESYLIESIKKPNAKIVSGYTKGAMPVIPLTDQEINALLVYIESVK